MVWLMFPNEGKAVSMKPPYLTYTVLRIILDPSSFQSKTTKAAKPRWLSLNHGSFFTHRVIYPTQVELKMRNV